MRIRDFWFSNRSMHGIGFWKLKGIRGTRSLPNEEAGRFAGAPRKVEDNGGTVVVRTQKREKQGLAFNLRNLKGKTKWVFEMRIWLTQRVEESTWAQRIAGIYGGSGLLQFLENGIFGLDAWFAGMGRERRLRGTRWQRCMPWSVPDGSWRHGRARLCLRARERRRRTREEEEEEVRERGGDAGP